MLESGPAAGVIGALALCRSLGLQDAVAFDMGGTTAKAGVVWQGQALTTTSALIGGYNQALPIQIPMIDIFEVGTGGGSIAEVGLGDALHVGPQSSGAEPGPACYAQGGSAATVTDANLVLGRLDPNNFLGGTMVLDVAEAEVAIAETIAKPLGLSAEEAAAGIIDIAVTKMAYAIKAVSTERGLDAASFPMIAYGGAGPLHAVAIAREIGTRKVIIPLAPGHFCAFGMLHADLRYDRVATWFAKLKDVSFDQLRDIWAELIEQGREALSASQVPVRDVEITYLADMRYVGQEHSVTLEVADDVLSSGDRDLLKQLFDAVHERRYGTCAPQEPAEITALRATVIGVMRRPALASAGTKAGPDPRAAERTKRPVYFRESSGFVEVPVYDRGRLRYGNVISGPALVEEHASTTVLFSGDRLEVDTLGNLVIDVGHAQC
jgi:N-methylhydantoinase A